MKTAVNVRSGAGKEFPRIGGLSAGDIVASFAFETGTDGATYRRIAWQDGYGYVNAAFLDWFMPKDFTVNVDLNTLKVEVIPHLWLIGAFSWGWTLAEAEEMTWDSATRTFSWTGQLYQGAFKFLVVNTDWYGYWRNSTDDNYWIAGEADAGDPQFDIAHDGLEAGIYTITFNLDTKVVTVTPAS